MKGKVAVFSQEYRARKSSFGWHACISITQIDSVCHAVLIPLLGDEMHQAMSGVAHGAPLYRMFSGRDGKSMHVWQLSTTRAYFDNMASLVQPMPESITTLRRQIMTECDLLLIAIQKSGGEIGIVSSAYGVSPAIYGEIPFDLPEEIEVKNPGQASYWT
jgi:hypothetical protein